MNLFLAGISQRALAGEPAQEALRPIVARVASLGAPAVRTWRAPSARAVLAWAAHAPESVGGIRYVHLEPGRFALFSGRPLLHEGDGEGDGADGRGPLDPALYLADESRWADRLDGRCAVLRYDDESAELLALTDPFGSYPLYTAVADGARWVSNSAAALRAVAGDGGVRADAAARFLACGWSLGGAPLWRGVERLPRGSVHTWRADGSERRRETLPVEALAGQFEAGFSAPAAAAALKAHVRAASDWPGRAAAVPLTGGRDSRVVFAALSAAGVPVSAETTAAPHLPGFPDTADVTIARRLAAAAAVAHSTTAPRQEALDLPAAMSALRLVTHGAFSLSSIPGGVAASLSGQGDVQPVAPRLLFGGANGEISRLYYGSGEGLSPRELERRLVGRLVPRYPPPLLTRGGLELVRAYVRDWVAEHMARGLAARDVPDAFYLLERMQHWGGPTHAVFEYADDVVSALWSTSAVRHQLALPAAARAHAQFHSLVLRELAPDLAAIPYEGASYGTGRRARAAKLARQARAEMLRRTRRGAAPGAAVDPLVTSFGQIGEVVLGQSSDHPAWTTIDRRRAGRLLSRSPERLDPRSREQCWRLAAVFVAAGP